MRRAVAAIITAALCSVAQAEEAYLAPLVEKSILLDIDASDYVVIVGERGHILTSTDGTQFTQSEAPTQSTLTATTIVGDDVWAVGHDAIILHSSDRGKTWQQQYSDPDMERPFLDVLFFNNQHGIAVGAYGTFYRTRDGGASWAAERHASLLAPMDREYLEEIRKEDEDFYQQELNTILPHINRITRDGDTVYMAGEAGLLAVSHDQGETWVRYDVDYSGSFFDIRPLDANTVLAVGLRGNIFVMRDGETWDYVNSCSTSTLNSILVESDNRVAALGNNGIIVSAQRPLPVSFHDPYAQPEECKPASGIKVTQVEDKAALVNAVSFKGHTIAVSGKGIKQLNLD